MQSIAEVMTPELMLYLRFDDADSEQVAQVQEQLAHMADEGLVLELGFHISQ